MVGEINNMAPTDQRAARHRPGNISLGRVAFAHLLCRKSGTDTDSLIQDVILSIKLLFVCMSTRIMPKGLIWSFEEI